MGRPRAPAIWEATSSQFKKDFFIVNSQSTSLNKAGKCLLQTIYSDVLVAAQISAIQAEAATCSSTMTTEDRSPNAQAQEKSCPAATDHSSAQSSPGEDSSQGLTSAGADPSDAVENRNTMISIAPSINPSLYSEADPTDATIMIVQQARPRPVTIESYHTAQEQPDSDPTAGQADQRENHTEEDRQAHPAPMAVAAEERPSSDHVAQQDNRTEENGKSNTANPELRAAIQDALHGIPARTSSMQYHDETVGPGGYIDPSQPQPPTLLGHQASAASSQTRPTQLPGGGPWAAPPSPNTANAEQLDSEEENDSQ